MIASRLTHLRDRMQSAGVEAFFSVHPPANQYLTGFCGSTSAVVVTGNRAVFLCDFRYAEQAEDQVAPEFEVTQTAGSLLRRTGECLAECGVANAAYEPDALRVSELNAVAAAVHADLRAMPGLVGGMRQIKTSEEVEAIRKALTLAAGVHDDIVQALVPGVTEREVAARFEYEFKRRGASAAAFDTIVLFGARSSLPHGQATDRALAPGDAVLVDFGCRLGGYCSDLTRTYCFGRIPGAWFERVYEVVLTSQAAALKAAKPGMTCRELDAVARSIIQDAGYGERFGHGLGHGVGIEIHEAPRVNAEGDTVLAPGMVVTLEPGIYLPGQGGIRIEDVIVITDSGCEALSATPKELKILGLKA